MPLTTYVQGVLSQAVHWRDRKLVRARGSSQGPPPFDFTFARQVKKSHDSPFGRVLGSHMGTS